MCRIFPSKFVDSVGVILGIAILKFPKKIKKDLMLMHRVYKEKEYVIYKADCGYIVQNILMKDFAHTHLDSYDQARRIVGLSIHKKVPRDLSRYMLISLLRVNKDDKYLKKVNELLENKKPKQEYINRHSKK